MKISEISKENRPRERFLKLSPSALSDAELFAIILRTGTFEENVIDMSNRLINKFGLEKLFDCSLKELQTIKGIGQIKAMQILAISELGKRYNQKKKKITQIKNAEDVFNLFHEKLKSETQENFIVLLLNNKNNILNDFLVSKGILDSTIIHPREIFRPAIKNSASRIIIVHNHPSGDPHPSEEDIEITKKIIEAGQIIDIKVLDHVIIGRDKFWSWIENN
ncbi:MAG: RadC family protein [Nanoarchaeota archaeon]